MAGYRQEKNSQGNAFLKIRAKLPKIPLISFYSQDYSFIVPNSNKDKHYKRQETSETATLEHNGYVLTLYNASRPENS